MTNFHAIWIWADKCKQNKLMHEESLYFTISVEIYIHMMTMIVVTRDTSTSLAMA